VPIGAVRQHLAYWWAQFLHLCGVCRKGCAKFCCRECAVFWSLCVLHGKSSSQCPLCWWQSFCVPVQQSMASRSVSIWPVLKHGPRSLTCARVTQSWIGSRGAMKVKLVKLRSLCGHALCVTVGRSNSPPISYINDMAEL